MSLHSELVTTEHGRDIWADVVGQDDAVRQLRAVATGGSHAYLFVGPHGCTKEEAARSLAALLLSGGEAVDHRDARLALAGTHPDVKEVRRVGPAISAEQAREIVRLASLAPVEGARKVMILDEFHLLRAEGAGLLLKTIEEPPPSTTFVILCDFVPSELVTISSRCTRIEFRTIPTDIVTERLVTEGIDRATAAEAAASADGDLGRARVLAVDPTLATRRRAFGELPHRLNGTGAVATQAAAELLALIDDAATPLQERHAGEMADLEDAARNTGARVSTKDTEERHKRELRRYRTDEIRSGLAILAATYRDAAAGGTAADVDGCIDAVHRIHVALEALERNPNERLLLESLLWSLPDTAGVA